YDTAKHIGLPSDPTDAKVQRNNFWPVVTGREAAKGLSLLMPDSLFIYGEVLQDVNVKEKEYTEFIDVTASNYGHALRTVLEKENALAADLKAWHHKASPDSLVTWVESHDTYCNQHESAHLTDDQVRMGWVFLTARQNGTPLFFSRPAGSTRINYWGNNLVGPRGNDEFKHPEVVAVNRFRAAMAGEPEQIFTTPKGEVAQVSRGDKGAALVNFTNKPHSVKIETNLPDGTYTDTVHHATFVVKSGKLMGKLLPLTSYLIVK
ncbi:MAG: alpha-amylase, partial [Paramuribaculum sp.]|nr:alpha-amylase [Paramuribaculum sp.]